MVPAVASAELAAALRLRTVLPANWAAGLRECVQQGVFVTPPVGGHTFAVGADLRALLLADPEASAELLTALSQQFGEALWFCSDDEADGYGWMRAAAGTLLRGVVFRGEQGVVFECGTITRDEQDLGCFVALPFDSSDDGQHWWPDHRLVLALAERWGADPRRITGEPGVGCVGRR